MDESEMEERRAALRLRVQSQLEASQAATESRKQAASEELVVHSSELERAVEKATVKFQEKIEELDQSDRSRILTLAASLILIGSIFGMATGALILNGNPDELLNSTLFETTDTVDVTGLAVEAVDGNGVENVTIQLLRFGTDEVIGETLTDSYGYFNFKQVITQATTMKVISDGYVTVERDFIPEEAGVRPITMTPGEGERYENHITDNGGWTLESAVA
ncbi:MAG: carboxypeptidase regulatory-like domain-containing protein, partial [Euryarchaeota archaeon]|nr:carboxypeptidase regulatory-like domain-containing protein [Euryarchaeota archaeon]